MSANLGTMTASLFVLWALACHTVRAAESVRPVMCHWGHCLPPLRIPDWLFSRRGTLSLSLRKKLTLTSRSPKAHVSWTCRLTTGDCSPETFFGKARTLQLVGKSMPAIEIYDLHIHDCKAPVLIQACPLPICNVPLTMAAGATCVSVGDRQHDQHDQHDQTSKKANKQTSKQQTTKQQTTQTHSNTNWQCTNKEINQQSIEAELSKAEDFGKETCRSKDQSTKIQSQK